MPVVDYRQFINRDLPLRVRACESKAMYITRGEARSASHKGRSQDGSLRPYHCRFCDRWHLGHRHRRR